MSSTFAPIDAATISALNAGGERALEQIFREHYPWLLERALERLKGENAAAPRLITATVRELWDERDGFHSSAEIEAFFNEELRHRARAIRARMTAVHRFEKAEGVHVAPPTTTPTADQLWAEVAADLHKPQVDPATAAKRRREHRSHEVAEHIQTVTERANWKMPVILIAVAAVVALGAAQIFGKVARADVINQMLGAATAQQVSTRAGQLGSVTLADNSTARLAPETRLVIVESFGTDYRTLTVAGSAVFNVTAGNAEDFEARLGDVSVFSKGGVFSVRDYGEEMTRMVRADSGDLHLMVGGTSHNLKSGEAVSISRTGEITTPDAAVVAQELSWTADRLTLRDVSASTAIQSLWRWYGMDVTLADSSAAARVVSIDVPLGQSQAAIAAVEGAAQLRFELVDRKMIFQSAAAPARRR
jgi:ferric-dicitrate binding protein FerR (iron transport regulator)